MYVYIFSKNKVYTDLKDGKSHIVNTSWVLLALIQTDQVLVSLISSTFDMINYSTMLARV